MGNPMEELRVRLDELGVAWWQRKCHTCWKVEKKQGTEHWRAWLAPDGTITLKVDAIYGFTPEQAVTATVGAGTLTAEQVRECSKGVYFEGYSDGATHRVNGIEETDWQAIADELNAMVGVGTCELINAADDLGEGTSSCMCSKCGYTALDDWWDEFKYCPNCGRRIVEEEAE